MPPPSAGLSDVLDRRVSLEQQSLHMLAEDGFLDYAPEDLEWLGETIYEESERVQI